MIRIEELKLKISHDETALQKLIADTLRIADHQIHSFSLVKKAIDSRKKSDICFVYTVDVAVSDEKTVLESLLNADQEAIRHAVKYHRIRLSEPFHYIIPTCSFSDKKPILIAGAGPCGLFAALALAKAGLNPVVVERGKKVDQRIADVDLFFKSGILNPESNVQFGEGGAGTFSDGKLYTLVNDKRTAFIFNTFVECGAPPEILYDAKPHIGTDILRKVVVNLREKIIALGGTFRFETKLTDIRVRNGVLQSVILNEKEEMPVSTLILAIGHSARDSFKMLFDHKLNIRQKAFSVGVRIEHPAAFINRSQYGNFAAHPLLPPAKYKLATHLSNGRSVYTFCMCPGGYVVAASSEENHIVVNGMSEYRQSGVNSNSAVLVNVYPSDFESEHPLAGIDFQRKIEKKAFELGGNNYHAPVQLLGDFLKDRKSMAFSDVFPTYKPDVTFSKLSDCLPKFVVESLKLGILEMDKKLHGFASPSALLTAPETRSSAPIRIVRNEQGMSSVQHIFPAGEGAGHAGGIVSSAIDGLRIAEQVMGSLHEKSLYL